MNMPSPRIVSEAYASQIELYVLRAATLPEYTDDVVRQAWRVTRG
ncbi:MAG TPA: hypothetical protein VHI13_18560 [Candidatus Kapabacteria bacterium]|nr:hypothetical protein [Candidatus Kapabacteria bacterium]